jgi:hypothetical protein
LQRIQPALIGISVTINKRPSFSTDSRLSDFSVPPATEYSGGHENYDANFAQDLALVSSMKSNTPRGCCVSCGSSISTFGSITCSKKAGKQSTQAAMKIMTPISHKILPWIHLFLVLCQYILVSSCGSSISTFGSITCSKKAGKLLRPEYTGTVLGIKISVYPLQQSTQAAMKIMTPISHKILPWIHLFLVPESLESGVVVISEN